MQYTEEQIILIRESWERMKEMGMQELGLLIFHRWEGRWFETRSHHRCKNVITRFWIKTNVSSTFKGEKRQIMLEKLKRIKANKWQKQKWTRFKHSFSYFCYLFAKEKFLLLQKIQVDRLLDK